MCIEAAGSQATDSDMLTTRQICLLVLSYAAVFHQSQEAYERHRVAKEAGTGGVMTPLDKLGPGAQQLKLNLEGK